MPCQSDYLAAIGQELESKRVCDLLIYLCEGLGKILPAWVWAASRDYYGNVARLDEATKMLCELCRSLTTEDQAAWMYDGRIPKARELAAWWDRHQAWDRRRAQEGAECRKRIVLRERALRKLTTEEMEALELKDGRGWRD